MKKIWQKVKAELKVTWEDWIINWRSYVCFTVTFVAVLFAIAVYNDKQSGAFDHTEYIVVGDEALYRYDDEDAARAAAIKYRDEIIENTKSEIEASAEPEILTTLNPEPDTTALAAKEARKKFYDDHSWNGELTEMEDHIVSISDSGAIMVDGTNASLRYAVEPPWGIFGHAIYDISTREDLYVNMSSSGEIEHYHFGELTEKFKPSNNAYRYYSQWKKVDALEDTIIGESYAYGYVLLNYKTGEFSEISDEEAKKYWPEDESYEDTDLIPLSDEEKELVHIAREAYANGWDGKFSEIADGIYAIVTLNDHLSVNNGEFELSLSMTEFKPVTYADNVYSNWSFMNEGNGGYPCTLFAKNGVLTAFTPEADPIEFELPEAGVHEILGAAFNLTDNYHYEDDHYVTYLSERTFNAVIETMREDGTLRLDIVSVNLDYVLEDGDYEHAIFAVDENISGARIWDGQLIFARGNTVYVGNRWNVYDSFHLYALDDYKLFDLRN